MFFLEILNGFMFRLIQIHRHHLVSYRQTAGIDESLENLSFL